MLIDISAEAMLNFASAVLVSVGLFLIESQQL